MSNKHKPIGPAFPGATHAHTGGTCLGCGVNLTGVWYDYQLCDACLIGTPVAPKISNGRERY